MNEDKAITMEILSFIKYKDECYEVGELIKHLLNKLDENNKEIERLNNIINELEKYLIEQVEKSYSNDYDNVLDKLDELKGSE